MKCPQDVDVDLVMSERQGVEIDYCPSCRGVWLDRGELDKILDRAAALTGPPAAGAAGHVAGHVSGEGGPGPASAPVPPSGYDAGASGGYGAGGYGPGGYGAGGYGGGGLGDDRDRYGDDRGRYGDDRDRYTGDRGRYDDRSRSGRPGYDPRKKRKESWLGDLLDFG